MILRQHSITPTPAAAKVLIYKDDLKAAVARLDSAWNVAQIKDALISVRYWTEVLENAT